MSFPTKCADGRCGGLDFALLDGASAASTFAEIVAKVQGGKGVAKGGEAAKAAKDAKETAEAAVEAVTVTVGPVAIADSAAAALEEFAKNAAEKYNRALAAKTAADAYQQALAAKTALKAKHAEENAVIAREQAEAERLMDSAVKEAALRLEFEAWIGRKQEILKQRSYTVK